MSSRFHAVDAGSRLIPDRPEHTSRAVRVQSCGSGGAIGCSRNQSEHCAGDPCVVPRDRAGANDRELRSCVYAEWRRGRGCQVEAAAACRRGPGKAAHRLERAARRWCPASSSFFRECARACVRVHVSSGDGCDKWVLVSTDMCLKGLQFSACGPLVERLLRLVPRGRNRARASTIAPQTRRTGCDGATRASACGPSMGSARTRDR